ncbi:MAG TPA: MBL fold metallo-hydrolase [Blastocatellia bacterium]|nr:MBL fold metallo-hydrolase [Blastocatellia bacterium]
MKIRTLILLWLIASFASAGQSQKPYVVKCIAPDIYFFSCNFYSNIFIVTSDGVIATDPINPDVAKLYDQAIKEVTDRPVRYVIYSHDHTDHISGGAVFSKTAQFISHENARSRIVERNNPDIVVPQITFKSEYVLEVGGKKVRLIYFGENHSNSSIGVYLPGEKILMLVDMVYPGSVPFRDLPGTDVRKFLDTLPKLGQLEFTTLICGHGPPGPRDWVDKYRMYFNDLISAVRKNLNELGYYETVKHSGIANARGVLDAAIERVAERAVDELRPKYGRWGGYDEWAVMNATRIALFLIMEG